MLASPMETSMLLKNIYENCQGELCKSIDACNVKMVFSSMSMYYHDDSDDDNDDLTFYRDTSCSNGKQEFSVIKWQ